MLAPITIRYPFRANRRSLISAEVADVFGLSGEEPPHTIAEQLQFDVRRGDLVLFTGPSGSGKSSLLRAVAAQLNAEDAMSLDLPDVPIVEAVPGSTEERLATLAACGLSEARLLLRTPRELSDGQRYRFRMAYALARKPEALQCDEFTALLDRTLAKVLAFNVRKLVNRCGATLLCATTHEDIAEDLNPNLHVQCHGDGRITTTRCDPKKNESACTTASGSVPVPVPIGRTSLGGITARTASAACGK